MSAELQREELIEAAASAFRTREPGGRVRPHPAWCDLDSSGREEAFEAARVLRTFEAALDPQGLSTTSKAVLARLKATR